MTAMAVGRGRGWWRTTFLVVIALLVLGSAQQIRAGTPEQAALQADTETTGRSLFEGAVRLDNGGPPCLACHSIGGIGALGGGTLGPDLTGAYEKFGPEGIASILATTPFATMNPIFSERPLTEGEQAAIAAFMEGVSVTEREAASVGRLALIGLVGAIVLLGIARYFWSRRVTAVRQPMLAQARALIENPQAEGR